MSRINIGGFNLNSNEIIEVSSKESLRTKFLSVITGIGIFGAMGVLVTTFTKQENILGGIITAIILGSIGIIFMLLKEKLESFTITVKTMSNGKIEKYQRTFNANRDSFEIYEKLKGYIK